MSACTATTIAGAPCRMAAQRDQSFCFAHNPTNATTRPEIARQAGHTSGVTRRRIARNRRLRREEAISLFNHSERCICLVCCIIRLSTPPARQRPPSVRTNPNQSKH